MKKDVFQNCPTYQSERFEIRKMEMKDAHGLFQCYSNPQAARYFNGDCCGDDFYYTDYEKFLECMKFWESRYQVRDFVRFTIVDQKQKEIAGMVEICPSYKYSADGSKIGILRIDLLPEYENEKMIKELLTVILEHIYEDFVSDGRFSPFRVGLKTPISVNLKSPMHHVCMLLTVTHFYTPYVLRYQPQDQVFPACVPGNCHL